MNRRIRFSKDLTIRPTVSDSDPRVEYATLDSETMPEGIRLLPPCSPTKIVCVGRNYADHAKELGNEVPKEPLLFLKPPSSLIAHGDQILYPALSQRVDFEGELAVIISKPARHVKAGDAMDYVLGYTCLNDITARDLQKKDGQWTRGKGFDTFCAVGPWMIERDQVDLASVRVSTLLNGEMKQNAPITQMIFTVPFVIEYMTQFLTLEPGDIIATGTPEGVGPMQPGDTVSIVLEGVGALTNPVVKE